MWSQGKKQCSRSRAAGVILLANYPVGPFTCIWGTGRCWLEEGWKAACCPGRSKSRRQCPSPPSSIVICSRTIWRLKIGCKNEWSTDSEHENMSNSLKFGWAELDRPRGVKPKRTCGLTIRAASLKQGCLRLRMTWRAHGQRPLGPDPRLSSLVCQGGAKDGKPDVAAAGQGTTVWEPPYWGVWL